MALTTNLVSYWKLDEASGNAVDSVGGNTLVNTNTVTYAAGKVNNGANFVAASSQRLTIASPTGLDLLSDLSMSFWFKPASQVDAYLIGKYKTTGSDGYNLCYYGTTGTPRLGLNIGGSGTNEQISANVVLTNGTWYHIVVTWKASTSTATFYVNGASIGAPTGAITALIATSTGFNIGALSDDNLAGTYVNGLVDEAGVWSRVLTSTEAFQLYNFSLGNAYPFVSNQSYSETSVTSDVLNITQGASPVETSVTSDVLKINIGWTNQSKSSPTWSNALKS